MLGKTHRSFAVASAGVTLLTLSSTTDLFTQMSTPELASQTAIVVATSYFTASLPDIDRFIPFLAHRGLTHSIWVPAGIIYAAIQYIGHPIYFPILLGLAIAYSSHLLGDSFSKAGVAWFYPLQRYVRTPTGAFYVKGPRGPFQPLYTVGQRTLIPPTIIWYGLGVITLALFIMQYI